MDVSIKAETVEKYKRNDKDTVSPEVQIALLTGRIKSLTEHLKSFKKDHSLCLIMIIINVENFKRLQLQEVTDIKQLTSLVLKNKTLVLLINSTLNRVHY